MSAISMEILNKNQWRQVRLAEYQHYNKAELSIDFLWEQMRLLQSQYPGLWGVYFPLSDEPPFHKKIKQGDVDWAWPKVQGSDLLFYDQVYFFKKGKWGNLEPSVGRPVSKSDMVGIFVPGIAFSPSGDRMGRGGGFYDRFLNGFQGLRVGVCWHFQIFDSLPTDVWDQKMDKIVTDKTRIECTRQNKNEV